MLRYSFGLEEEARAVEGAVREVVREGVVTPDLGGRAGTEEVGTAVAQRVLRRET
jgi:isocitrate/isopropylmalate dehydrogenase